MWIVFLRNLVVKGKKEIGVGKGFIGWKKVFLFVCCFFNRKDFSIFLCWGDKICIAIEDVRERGWLIYLFVNNYWVFIKC